MRPDVFLPPPPPPPSWMGCHYSASPCRTPSSKFVGIHLYTWAKRGTMRVNCLVQEQNVVPRPGPWIKLATAQSPKITRKPSSFYNSLWPQCLVSMPQHGISLADMHFSILNVCHLFVQIFFLLLFMVEMWYATVCLASATWMELILTTIIRLVQNSPANSFLSPAGMK